MRSLNPLMRVSRRLLDTYVAAMADDEWAGHYEFTLATAALDAGLRIVDLGGERARSSRRAASAACTSAKSPAGRPDDLTFGFRPVREHYFQEDAGGVREAGPALPPGQARGARRGAARR